MFKLLKGGYCYSPSEMGKQDIFIVDGRIYRIGEVIEPWDTQDIEIIDCSDKLVCPGFIDQHLHITGGGGEEGPNSRIPEIMLGEIIEAGITTVVGVLGVDSITRNIAGLLAKARALEFEGITTYIYTGSYGVPTATLTGKAISDLTLIDKVIGIGEIAIADYRSTHPSLQLLKELASEARVGGLLGGKAGVLHIHTGDGKEGLKPLFELIEQSDFPIGMFVPTHQNRNKALFEQSLQFARRGGYIDLTAGESTDTGYSVKDAISYALKCGINPELITVSSDANGSMPVNSQNPEGVGKARQLFDDIRESIIEHKTGIENALMTVTSNVSKVLKLHPLKGTLSPGAHADVLVINSSDFTLDKVIAGGQLLVDGGKAIKKGRYEK